MMRYFAGSSWRSGAAVLVLCLAAGTAPVAAGAPASWDALFEPPAPAPQSTPDAAPPEGPRLGQMSFGQICRINPGLACFLQYPLPINSGCQCFFPEFNPPIYYGIVSFQ